MTLAQMDIVSETHNGATQEPYQQYSHRSEAQKPPIGGTIVLLAATGLLGLISAAVNRGATKEIDEKVHDVLQAKRAAPVDAVVRPVTVLSLPILVVAATAGLVAWLYQQDRPEAALAIGFAPVAAATLGQTFTMVFPQRNPPDVGGDQGEKVVQASFPSGHTTGVTAEALSIGYILNRERLISPSVLAVLLGWPFVVGATRLYRDRHWASDVLAGWVAGAAVAACSALLYDTIKARKPART